MRISSMIGPAFRWTGSEMSDERVGVDVGVATGAGLEVVVGLAVGTATGGDEVGGGEVAEPADGLGVGLPAPAQPAARRPQRSVVAASLVIGSVSGAGTRDRPLDA
jgi:hypothetical protein